MTDWASIAGGRCPGQPWRVGVAGFSVEQQQAFLLSDSDWDELLGQVPLEPLAIYGHGNGLLFERLTGALTLDLNGLLLIAHDWQGQPFFQPEPLLRQYLVLRRVVQRDAIVDETAYAKLFIPTVVPLYGERWVYVDSRVVTDPSSGNPQEWAVLQEPSDPDYAKSYPRSADFWINRITVAIADDAVAQRSNAPLLSVVIPAYNYGRFLDRCVQSVLDQNVDDMEVLVLDNASMDETPEVMAMFAADPRVRYMRNRHNLGGGHNWRNGLWVAQGRYFTFLSADDYFNPGHLARLLPVLESNPQVAVGYTSILWVNDKGQNLEQPRHPGYRNADYIGGRNEVADLLIHDCYMTPSAVIHRR